MKSITMGILLTLCVIASSQGQSAPIQHDGAFSPAVRRIKALQTQINKQQIEINTLRARMAKLQDAFQELADMVADESTDTDEDDFSDDSDVTGFVVNNPSSRTKRNATQIRRSAMAICNSRTLSCHGCGASLKKSKIQ